MGYFGGGLGSVATYIFTIDVHRRVLLRTKKTTKTMGFSTPRRPANTKVGYFMGYFRHAQSGLLQAGLDGTTEDLISQMYLKSI